MKYSVHIFIVSFIYFSPRWPSGVMMRCPFSLSMPFFVHVRLSLPVLSHFARDYRPNTLVAPRQEEKKTTSPKISFTAHHVHPVALQPPFLAPLEAQNRCRRVTGKEGGRCSRTKIRAGRQTKKSALSRWTQTQRANREGGKGRGRGEGRVGTEREKGTERLKSPTTPSTAKKKTRF